MLNIGHKNLFEQALVGGFNLFVGAGFSIYAKDQFDRPLPVGFQLRDELAEYFGKPKNFLLPQLASIINAADGLRLQKYLTERFQVKDYDPRYSNLCQLNIKNIYTTNIDNLLPKVIHDVGQKSFNNLISNGPAVEDNVINYMPLHGYVDNPNHEYVFDVSALANIHHNAPRIWGYLAQAVETYPTIFVGYSFNDSSVIQTITSQQTFRNAQKQMWILLRKEDLIYKEYYEAFGFHIIEGDLDEWLNYIVQFTPARKSRKQIDDERITLLKPYSIPLNEQDLTAQRPIKDFFLGSSPWWCDILNNQIYRTHYYAQIQDMIFDHSKKNIIIIGAPVSGKTTLLMQIAFSIQYNGIKLFFTQLSKERAEFIAKIIGTDNALIFLDNVADNVDAINVLKRNNIKIVGADRSHNFSIISHLIDESEYSIVNVTQLNNQDLQGVYRSLPTAVRVDELRLEETLAVYGRDSIFEFVLRNVTVPTIRDRYKKAIVKIEKDDPLLAEFMVLCAYVHRCHIPLSFEMAYDYFSGVYSSVNYSDIFELKDDSLDIIKDYIPIPSDRLYAKMDYYYPRSQYAAEVIIDSCSSVLLREVLVNFIQNIDSYKVCNYRTFRKYAFDKVITAKAFANWEEGKQFYEEVFLYDNKNPYVLQQGALYLAQKHKYDIAFNWIDKAITMTNDTYFSIRNSHAIILFSANIEKSDENARVGIEHSMEILERCMSHDSRKRFHAITYGRQAVQYNEKYKDALGEKYLNQAKEWLKKEKLTNKWDYELDKALEAVKNALGENI